MGRILDIFTVENTDQNSEGLIIMPVSSGLISQIKNRGEDLSSGQLSLKDFGHMVTRLLESSPLSQPLMWHATWSRNDTEKMLDNFTLKWIQIRGLQNKLPLSTQQCLDVLASDRFGLTNIMRTLIPRIQYQLEDGKVDRHGITISDMSSWIRDLTWLLKRRAKVVGSKINWTKDGPLFKVKKSARKLS
jgi:hypothetical protein